MVATVGAAAAASMWLTTAPAAHAAPCTPGAGFTQACSDCAFNIARWAHPGEDVAAEVTERCYGAAPVQGADYPDCDGLIPTQHAMCVERHMSGQN